METSIRFDRIITVVLIALNILTLILFLLTGDDALVMLWGATLFPAVFAGVVVWAERND